MRTGTARLPLHYGRAPAWLFHRMKELAREISLVIIDQLGGIMIYPSMFFARRSRRPRSAEGRSLRR
ncbi:MAG: DUF763 domain-containing protein [Thermodesulfobacteriota bacterium]